MRIEPRDVFGLVLPTACDGCGSGAAVNRERWTATAKKKLCVKPPRVDRLSHDPTSPTHAET